MNKPGTIQVTPEGCPVYRTRPRTFFLFFSGAGSEYRNVVDPVPRR
jgi:hypothetical protein